jgi:Short C-terminal domain
MKLLSEDDARTNEQAANAAAGTPSIPVEAPDPADRLVRLAGLRDRGVLTEDEFSSQKAKILGAM